MQEDRNMLCNEGKARELLVSQKLLHRITAHYLHSGDFNGYYVSNDFSDAVTVGAIKRLVSMGMIDIIFSDDQAYANIKAFPPKSREQQLNRINKGKWSGFAYPSPSYLSSCVDMSKYKGMPYSLLVAQGMPQMTERFFCSNILDIYKNSSNYAVRDYVSNGYICKINNNFWEEILCVFSYADITGDKSHVRVFVLYLHKMPPVHQRLWKEFEYQVA